MISAVKELGNLILKHEEKTILSTLIESINKERYPNMICVVLDANDPYFLNDVILEETNAVSGEKYLYCKKAPNGPNFSPTAIITELEKTYQNKFFGWFVSAEKDRSLNKESKEFFLKIKKSLETHKELIIEKISQIITNPKDGWVLTLKFGEDYLLDIPQFREYFVKSIFTEEEKISTGNSICSVCGEKKDKIFGGASPFKFYTIDKPGFISGEFNEKLSWRNFPVCSDCYLALIEGKNIIKEHLTFRFYGLSYMLIPNFIIGKTNQEEIIDILINRSHKQIQLSQKTEDNLTTYEDDILKYLAEAQDDVTFHFLFMQTQQSAERILLIIEDVLPSRLRTIFKAKKEADLLFPQSKFHLGKLRDFLGKSDPGKNNTDLDKYFLEIINAIFKGIAIEFKFLTVHFMREIRRGFHNSDNGNIFYRVNDAIQCTYFLSRLGLLDRKEVKTLETMFDRIFTTYAEQLDTNKKRGIFLLGSLTQMLLNIQWKERNAQPFVSQLKGLKMNEQDIQGLLPKVVNKLTEYERYDMQKRKMVEEITRLMLCSDKKKSLTIDEINFFFVCGMSLAHESATILYGKTDKEENNHDDNE